jgi:hypothetical protein
MRHIWVGLRALGEALGWGASGAALYGVVTAFVYGSNVDDLQYLPTVALFFGTFGLLIGGVTGLVGAVGAALLSLIEVSSAVARLVSGLLSGVVVTMTVWWLFGRSDEDDLIQLLETPTDWMQFVVVPGVLAVAIGAWRAPRILSTGLPNVAPSTQRV